MKKFVTSYPFSSTTELIQYNDNTFRIINLKYKREKGWELKGKAENLDFQFGEKSESERISLVRTKSRIRELALCNNFEYFGTITINGDYFYRYDLNIIQNELKNTIAAENLIEKVDTEINARLKNPKDFQVFLTPNNNEYYRIYINNYVIFYTIHNNTMVVRRMFYFRSV